MNFSITQLDFTLTALSKLSLREHPESAFRGVFGQELRKLCCVSGLDECSNCRFTLQCAYQQIFEPVMTPDEIEKSSKRFQTKPRPYIIEVKHHRDTLYPGEEIILRFRFFSNVKPYLPFIISACQKVGQTGIGTDGGKFVISEIWNVNPLVGKAERIYSEYLNVVNNLNECMQFNQIENLVSEMASDRIRLKILTPMSLKSNGKYVSKVKFDLLMKNLFRRLSSLIFFYGEGALDLDFQELLSIASKVELVKDRTHLERWDRYSNRQQQKVKMAGIIGEVEYHGELEPFLPYLVLGQYCYIGKNTVFGQGNYKIIPR